MKIERAASTALLGKKNAGLVTLIASELVNDWDLPFSDLLNRS